MALGKKRLPTPKEERLPFFKFLAWKSSDVASAAAFVIVNTYLMRFCTDFLGMDPFVVGNVLLISNIVDFITDFFGAIIVDNTNTKLGRGRPYELSIVGVTVCTILLFATPASWSNGVKIAWVFFVYTFEFGVFNTLRNAAQNVYCVRAWKNRKVIGKMASYGGMVTTLGSMVVTTTFPMMMATMATTAEGWLRLVAIYMIPMTLIGILRFVFVKEDTSVSVDKHEKVDLKALMGMLKKNKYAWLYASVVFLFNTITSLGVSSYYWRYIVGNESLSGIVSIMGTLMLPIMFVFPVLMKKLSAPQLIGFGAIVSVSGYLINFFAGANVPLLMVGGLLSAFAMLPISYLGILIILDLATYNKHLGLPSMEASIGAIFNGFGTQLGQGVGGWLTGVLLSVAGYMASDGSTAVTQPDSALTMIRCLYSIIPLILMVLVGVCAFRLANLSKQMPEIEAKLAESEAAK